MIIRGGENLYPKEIEAVIARLRGRPRVRRVGEPDDVLGEVPVAYVVAYPGATVHRGRPARRTAARSSPG